MKEHRINVRFNLENETDRMIVAYLDGLRGKQQISRNSFIIQAIYEIIMEDDRNAALVEQIRAVLKEELSTISVVAASDEPDEPETDFSFEVTEEDLEKRPWEQASEVHHHGGGLGGDENERDILRCTISQTGSPQRKETGADSSRTFDPESRLAYPA